MRFLIVILLMLLAYVFLAGIREHLGGWLAVSLGTFCLLAGLIAWLYKRRIPGHSFVSFRSVRRSEIFGFVCVGMIVLMVLFFSFLHGPGAAEQIRNDVVASGEWSEQGDSSDGRKPTGDNKNLSFGMRNGVSEIPGISIPSRGKLQRPEFPEVRIHPLDQSTSDLMRNNTTYVTMKWANAFDGFNNWTVEDPSFTTVQADDEGWVKIGDRRQAERYYYRMTQPFSNQYLYAMQGVVKVRQPQLRGASGSHYTLANVSEEKMVRKYECVSFPILFDNFSAEQKKLLKVAETAPVFSENTFNNRLREKLKKDAASIRAAKLSGVAETLEVIRNTLHNNCEYSLIVRNTANVPPMENFIFGSEKKGWCTHFASAAALFCRELGIPCRIASGYTQGKYFANKDRWVFYTTNAHAWLEVKLEGYGWVVFETTPEDFLEENIIPNKGDQGNFPTDKEKSDYWKNQREGGVSEVLDMNETVAEIKWMVFLICVLLAILGSIRVWQRKQYRKRRRNGEEEDERSTYEEKLYLATYRKMCQINSYPMLSGDTLLRHMEWLEQKGKKPEFGDELLTYHYDTTYQSQDTEKKIEGDLIKRIRKWKV